MKLNGLCKTSNYDFINVRFCVYGNLVVQSPLIENFSGQVTYELITQVGTHQV